MFSRPFPRLFVVLGAVAVVAVIGAAWLVARPGVARNRALGLTGALVAAAGTTHASGERRKPNRLIHEKSPYLLQHAYNPVDWRPWGDEAFAEARREDKPIFLSIGYSTCHWCHVMERESFEDDSIAALLNRDFIPIKVDREERPDVDRIYMTSMQALGMGGGWPLNAFLTPNLEPFYGGTYFPPHAMHGRPGMTELLPRVAEAWKEHRADLEQTGQRVLEALAGESAADPTGVAHEALFASAYDSLNRSHDRELGGFGTAPKFPTTVNLSFLFRYWAHDPAHRAAAKAIALGQLDAMRTGGIHDQIGGGFHRYSTDREWLTPHFEKMLYDQAQLAWSYLEAYQITGERRYAETARGIFDYVTRDLTAKDGGFDSAEDADSEGEEGKFYVWTPAEVDAALGPDDAALVAYRYGVTAAGNFEHGASILHLAHTLQETATHVHVSEVETEKRLVAARTKLLAARGQRVRPHRDDKVLTAWNGLMISAYARGACVLDDPALAAHASRAGEFAWTTLRDPATGALRRRWRDGEAAGDGQLDDYANLALGFVDLYEATFESKWLERAVAITETMMPRFWDDEHGAFFESPAGDASIRVRMKDGYDGAEIAGNSIAALVLVRLGKLIERREWLERADRTLDYYARRIQRYPVAMPQMLVAMELAGTPPRHAVIAGDPNAADTRAMIAAYRRGFRPHDTLLLVDGAARQAALAKLAPFVAALTAKDGHATAYVCVNYACRLPTTDRSQFVAQLDEGLAATAEKR